MSESVREKDVDYHKPSDDSEFFNTIPVDTPTFNFPEPDSDAPFAPKYPNKELNLAEYRTKRFEILLQLGFPQEFLWMTKCKAREQFQEKWREQAGRIFPPDFPPQKYVLYLNSGDILLKTAGFNNFAEFLQSCEKLTEHAKTSLPTSIEDIIDELALDLPREWEHLPNQIFGESWFAGVAYLGDKVREVLRQDEILYIILKVQQKVKEQGAIEAVQTFKAEDETTVICSDTMRGKKDGWKMILSCF